MQALGDAIRLAVIERLLDYPASVSALVESLPLAVPEKRRAGCESILDHFAAHLAAATL